MDPKELRIGNCIYADGRIVEVVAIDGKQNDIEVRTQDNDVFKAKIDKVEIKPILLSEEDTHACCGFDQDGLLLLGIDAHSYFLKMNHDHIILLNKLGKPLIHFWDVKAVHQLQNLFYALKGKELAVSFKHHN